METISSIAQPFYLMPWGEYQFFGLTETVYDSPPEDARVLPDEVDFILAEANRLFLTLKLPPGGCGYSGCGVRPRTASTGKAGVKSFTLHDMEPEGMPNAFTATGVPIMVHRQAGRRITAAGKIRPSGQARALNPVERLLPTDGPDIGGFPVASLRAAATRAFEGAGGPDVPLRQHGLAARHGPCAMTLPIPLVVGITPHVLRPG